jgi:integrase
VFELHGKTMLDLDVRLIDTPLVLKVLEPIWSKKTETADRLRGRIENVLAWATVRGFRAGDNPARWRGHLDQLLPRPSKVSKVKHFASLPFSQIGAFMQELREQEGVGARALEFAILTAARSGEARCARWEEFDLASKLWRIPGSRMKAGREHVVPLSEAALAVMEKMKEHRLGGFVFPGMKEGKPISDMAMTVTLRRMKRSDITVHGFRSTFRDWAAEVSHYPHEVCEMALAHTISNKAEAAYRRGNLLAKRGAMMKDWARFCAQPQPAEAAVISIRKAAGTK